MDARTDIYSLGATLFSLVTGQPPYQGTTAQKLLQHQMKKPRRCRSSGATRAAEAQRGGGEDDGEEGRPTATRRLRGDRRAPRPWLPAALPLPNTVAGNPLSASDHITAGETVRDTKVRSKKKTQKKLEAEAGGRGRRSPSSRGPPWD